MTSITLHPVIPIWLIVLCVGFGLIGIWLTYGRCTLSLRHQLALIGVRLATILVLAALLLQPELLRLREKVEPPAMAVLIDTSASMLDSPGENNRLRVENMRLLLDSRPLRRVFDRYEVLWYEFGADLEKQSKRDPSELLFNAPRTHIVNAVNEVARLHRGSNLAGILLLTDGLDQSAGELEAQARRVPLIVPELTPPRQQKAEAGSDLFIGDIKHPEMLVVNWKGQIDVTVKRTGGRGKLVCPVHLSQRGERIRSGFATFAEGEMLQQVTFTIEPFMVGRMTYRIDLEPEQDEESSNNSRQFVIDITDPRNRVLYLEGTPRWEFKFVKRALVKEKNYHISAFVQSGEGVFINFSESTESASLGALPEFTAESLVEYRVIILGEMAATALRPEQQQALLEYVEKGGAVLFLGGRRAYGTEGWPSSEIMNQLLPFNALPESQGGEGRFSVAPTSIGRTHPVLAGLADEEVFPSILSIWGPVEKKPSAAALLEVADGSPLLLVNRYGQGKVAAVLSDSLWRWQLGASQTGEGKGVYDTFMTQLVYWLSPQQQEVEHSEALQLFTSSGEAEVRQQVTIGAVFGDVAGGSVNASLEALITLPDKRQLRQPLAAASLGKDVGLEQQVNGYRTSFVPGMPGEYQIEVKDARTGDTASTMILVSEPQLELTGRPIDRQFLQILAEHTGGAFVPLDDVVKELESISYEPLRVPSTDQQPLWNKAWILILLLALFTAEWYVRSKLDLV